MPYSHFTKGATLLSFGVLISLFLLYKTGRFDPVAGNSPSEELQGSPNSGPIKKNKSDAAAKRKKDSIEKARIRMSSSKSGIITDDVRMSSSKSGVIFTPKQDSVKKPESPKLKNLK